MTNATTQERRTKTGRKHANASGMRMCGFCSQTGSHDMCPGVIRHRGDELWRCQCPQEGCGRTRCTECYNTDPEQVTEQGKCIDSLACSEEIARRKRRIRVEMLGDFADRTPQTPASTPGTPGGVARAPRARSGQCLCCGEATKGGKFLPGHDSRYLTIQAQAVAAGEPLESVQAAMAAAGASPALQAKLAKRVGA